MTCTDTCCHPEPEIEYRVLSRRRVKAARTVHPCAYCRQEIAVGCPCLVTALLADGRFYAEYRHRRCPGNDPGEASARQ
jgi:hypothetical protein